MKLGQAKYQGEYTKKNNWKLKDGEQVYRILPPMGDLADSGRWSVFWNIHFGYKNSEGKMRPFQSPLVKNHKTKMIEVPDAALERIQKLKAELDKAKKEGNTAVAAKLEELVGQKGQFNLDSNHHINVMDQQGNIGVLKIRHRCKVALDATIKQLRAGGVDPLSVEDGRFLVFRRSGSGLDTTFNISVLKQKIDVPGIGTVEKDVKHVLTPEIIARLDKEAGKLDSLYPRPSAEEVARIVKEGAKAVDEILSKPKASERSMDEDFPDQDEEVLAEPLKAVEPKVAVKAAATEAKAQAQSVTAPVAQASPAPAATSIADLSGDDLLKSLGL